MTQVQSDLSDFHWLIEVLQTVDVGVLVLDLDYNITAWNGFMENNSGIDSADAIGQNLFDVYEEISVDWFKHKAETVKLLRNRAFTTWEQRPYVFKFNNNRPITGMTKYMYQNCTFIPVTDLTGVVTSLAVIVYDVTDVACSKLELNEANKRLGILSRVDGLTKLNNRSYWEGLFRNEFLKQKRRAHDMCLIMCDIDHFKSVNDTHGHTAGDDVIREVARVIRENSRTTDLTGRYGGEEFVMLLMDSNIDQGYTLAERLRDALAKTTIKTEGLELNVSLSLGIAPWSDSYSSPKDWIDASDKALYQSKSNGRNKTTIATFD